MEKWETEEYKIAERNYWINEAIYTEKERQRKAQRRSEIFEKVLEVMQENMILKITVAGGMAILMIMYGR